MRFTSLTQIQILNALNRLNSTFIKAGSCSFTGSLNAGLALEISAAAVQVLLEPLDYAILKRSPPFKDQELDLQTLPPELKAAGIELLLTPYLSVLSPLIDAHISVSSYQAQTKAADVFDSLSFTLQLPEGELPCRLILRNADALSTLQTLAERLLQHAPPSTGIDPAVSVGFAAGTMQLAPAELKSLRTGDALILDDCPAGRGEILLTAGELRALASLGPEGALTLKGGFYHKGNAMTDAPKAVPAAADAAAPAETDLTALEALKLEAVFELERQSFTLSELKELHQGSVVTLHNRDLTALKLMINGQCAALGRLIEVGDRYAFEITRLP